VTSQSHVVLLQHDQPRYWIAHQAGTGVCLPGSENYNQQIGIQLDQSQQVWISVRDL